jgi:hypothetical protein
LRKNANEHMIGASGCAAAERHPTLPDEEREERAATSGERDEVGALAESAKRSGWAASSAGRRDSRERMDDALRARIVLEYSIIINLCDVKVSDASAASGLVYCSHTH